jgi:hypothetical protein
MTAGAKGMGATAGRIPRLVRFGTWVLLFILVRGTLGLFFLGRHIYRAWGASEPRAHALEGLGLAQVLWTLQWALAGVALWALSRRRPLGRWLAVGLVLSLAYQPLREVWRALQVVSGHADLRLLGYRDAGEGFGGVVVNVPLALGLLAIGLGLALAGGVAEYFRPASSSGEDAGRRPTSGCS